MTSLRYPLCTPNLCLVAEAAGQGVSVPGGGQEVQGAVRVLSDLCCV